ncbi:MAG: hypothetical protein JNN28_12245 [Saprospiraceae bacterium]|nr:hypothetical protein [Saprospiraceae bacterium]
MNYKSLLYLLLIAIWGFIGCQNNSSTAAAYGSGKSTAPDAKTEFSRIQDFLKRYEEPSQFYSVTIALQSKVTGKNGTVLYINPDDLAAENGQPIGKNIEVELKELSNQRQLLSANAPTVSNGQLLVSGGAYFINLTSEGQQLKLKEGKTLSVEFPKLASEEMYLFYGQRDTLGQLNWIQSGQKFETLPPPRVASIEQRAEMPFSLIDSSRRRAQNKRPLTEEEKKAFEARVVNASFHDKLYKIVKLNQLGWINCDIFYKTPNTTSLQYAFNAEDSIVSAYVYVVFKNMNSVMQGSYFSLDHSDMGSNFQNVPLGAKTQIIAFSIKNGIIYAYNADLTIHANERITIKLQETNQEAVEKLLRSI